jgi:hypothetical protein
MRKLAASDIINLYEYEKVRNEFRSRIIDLKKRRRIEVGDKVSLTFENRDTIRFQIQEMVRAERIVDEHKVQEEIDVYNEILPDTNELSATLFIEITEREQIRADLDRFQGMDRGDCVFFDLEGHGRVFGRFEAGHSKEDRISAVQYVSFHFSPEQQGWLRDPKIPVALVVHHEHYQERAVLTPEQRATLSDDFEWPSAD